MTKPSAPQIVGVIFSRPDFQRAIRMRNPPDLFELRLDALSAAVQAIQNGVGKLPAPLIVTARHPREGGVNQLTSRERRELLRAFLPHATWIDLELRSARALAPVLREARTRGIRVIISFHDFTGTPSASRLDEVARRAQSLGRDMVKIATQTDTPAQLKRLLDFSRRSPGVVAMGIGKLGRESRFELARRGCTLNYAHLSASRVAGQLSIPELRRALP